MKPIQSRIISAVIALMCLLNLNAQAPEKMSYQAVIRNAEGSLLSEQTVGMQITILQGTASGSSVYQETHSLTTNINGLISIEIGDGTTTNDFSIIDWGNGPYFLRIETDPSGGTSYTLSGTSQLLSVPYALHSKTVENITEEDPVYATSAAADINADDISNLDNLSGMNTGDQNLSGLAEKSNVLELDNTSAFTPNADFEPATKKYIDDKLPVTYEVGDFAHGGIIFWVDESRMHGLVCVKEDQNDGEATNWSNGTDIHIGAHADGIYSGKFNTWMAVSAQGPSLSNYAAGLCADLRQTEGDVTYGDWYLPSAIELTEMYTHHAVIDARAIANGGSAFFYTPAHPYWTSCEMSSGLAVVVQFHSGSEDFTNKSFTGRVRAIRAF